MLRLERVQLGVFWMVKDVLGPMSSRLFGGLLAFGKWVAVPTPETLVFVRASRTCNPLMKLPAKK